ncbi:MAG: polysaccharide deacetylase family protein [Alphaproteobacteria bacterium]|jgi:peptidoglycan/xylan/chitin deacetylase (PgdA/CDA1 family)|nr:polysaccharide deacetylase family protein [Alphaproteobacteria bacterium]
MALPDDYLVYPRRARGMDHDRYDWSTLPERDKVAWPDGARVALWVVVALEWFPLDQTGKPFVLPGGFNRPYPDYWNYTTRDYGNRNGIFRVMKVLDELGIRASAAMNSAVAERHPSLVAEVDKRGWEVVAHGVDMGRPLYGGMDAAEEEAVIAESVTTLRRLSGQAVTGWLSPGRSESFATPDLLAKHGLAYLLDWANDDLPYPMRTEAGEIFAMPHSHEIDDRLIMVQNHHSEDSFEQQIKDQFDTLYAEAETGGGRVLAISLHPWVIGQPFRIKSLARALAHVMGHDGVWPATGAEILEAFKAQT